MSKKQPANYYIVSNSTDNSTVSATAVTSNRVEKPLSTGESKGSGFDSFREIVESLVFALFLAFLIKAFEAEAFVIPTGSMAPTLKGRHKDTFCNECGFPFQVNASEEVDNVTGQLTTARIVGGTCPQCGLTQVFDNAHSFTGDRILVSKSGFDFRPLRRWDVSVFRAPAEPRINFIKRIVGLPGERIKIEYGDIFVQHKLPNGEWGEFEIVRKPLLYLNQMLQTVHDNDYIPKHLAKTQWPNRWVDETTATEQRLAGWIPNEDGKSFRCSGNAVTTADTKKNESKIDFAQPVMKRELDEQFAGVQWLRYRHIEPLSSDWLSLVEERLPPAVESSRIITNNPRLITDSTAYNTGLVRQSGQRDDFSQFVRQTGTDQYRCQRPVESFGFNWTGDLAVSGEVTFDAPPESGSLLIFELVKGGTTFRCRIQPQEGKITLDIPEVEAFVPQIASWAFQAKKYRLTFMNIDEQMRLVINDKEVPFPNEGRYDDLCQPIANGRTGILSRDRDPTIKDLVPVSVGVRDIAVTIKHLKLERDIYYIAMGSRVQPVIAQTPGKFYDSNNRRCDRLFSTPTDFSNEEKLTAFLAAPNRWRGYGRTHSAFFELDEDQYLALGDNSGLSHDSRLWESETVPFCVDKKYLIGKAFYVYWPHGHMIPGTRLPFIPSFNKMRHVD